MLKEHGDLKLAIEGHTDNVGAAASNQTLSEQRAAAVRQYLIDKFSTALASSPKASALRNPSRRTTRPRAGRTIAASSW